MKVDITAIIGRTGKYSLIVVIAALILEHWKAISVNSTFLDALYAYLAINGGAAAIHFRYMERKSVTAKVCPQCGRNLQSKPSYSCPNCGTLKFDSSTKTSKE